ncbi:MAG: sulfite exporter TauE/SafE family protein [Hyphomicrobiales bacterium]
MTSETIIFILLGSAAGGFINGLAGFGTALFALGFFLNVMSPIQAVAMSVALSVISGLQGVWLVRNTMLDNKRRLMRFLLPGIIGIPIGVTALSYISADSLKIIIAVFLIAYGGYFSLRSNLPQIDRKTPIVDGTIGFLGGFLGGMASLSGALPTMWCSMRTLSKMETRAVLQPFNVVVLLLTTLMLAWRGAYTIQTLTYLLIALPSTMIFAQIGITVFKRLSNDHFRRLLIVMTFLAGIILIIRTLI